MAGHRASMQEVAYCDGSLFGWLLETNEAER
jgi:hypothetical protein